MYPVHIFLVRHGESVDNVAGLFAGSRDSPLTSHGVLQTRRLAAHLASRTSSIGQLEHIFASNLQRAYLTAEAIQDARNSLVPACEADTLADVVRLPELREKDFGSGEGQKFGARSEGTAKSSDSESHSSMRIRAGRFIDVHLAPAILREAPGAGKRSVVIVAHGIILNVLLRELLARFSLREIPYPENSGGDASQRPASTVSWSNTGYLEAVLTPRLANTERSLPATQPLCRQMAIGEQAVDETAPWSMFGISVKAINYVGHLQGLKKTRGGIGSAKFDEKQKTLTSFFSPSPKKRKAEEDLKR